jgi:alanine racemase
MPTTSVQRIRDCWVEVDLGVLEENVRAMRAAIRPETEIMFVVKANAYGHGMVPVAKRAAKAGVKWFAVAHLEEAIRIREALPWGRILMLGVPDPADVPALLQHRVVPIAVSERHGLRLAEAAVAAGATLPVHVKVDTGMSRLGVRWTEAPAVLQTLLEAPGLEVQGLCSHFATVDPERPELAQAQYRRFDEVARSCPRRLFRHISSSRALQFHRSWDLDAVRPGITLYGYGSAEAGMRVRTRPILSWKATVAQVKAVPAGAAVGYIGTHVTAAPTCLATLAAGYADGYLRTLSNRGHVLIRGRRRKVVGRVSMNWITVDVGADTDVTEGDEAVLLGEQGGEAIWADELARQCRTIAYEILTGINASIERRYVG